MKSRTFSGMITALSGLGFFFIAMYCAHFYEKKMWDDKITEIFNVVHATKTKITLERKMGLDLCSMSFIQRDLSIIEKNVACDTHAIDFIVIDNEPLSSVILYSNHKELIGHTAPMRWKKEMNDLFKKMKQTSFSSDGVNRICEKELEEKNTSFKEQDHRIFIYPLGGFEEDMIGAMFIKIHQNIFDKKMRSFYQYAFLWGLIFLALHYGVCVMCIRKIIFPLNQSIEKMMSVLKIWDNQNVFVPFFPNSPLEKEFDAAYQKGKSLFKLLDLIDHQRVGNHSHEIDQKDEHRAA